MAMRQSSVWWNEKNTQSRIGAVIAACDITDSMQEMRMKTSETEYIIEMARLTQCEERDRATRRELHGRINRVRELCSTDDTIAEMINKTNETRYIIDMTRKISISDLVTAVEQVPHKFTILDASEHHDLFKRKGIGNSVNMFIRSGTARHGIKIKHVGDVKVKVECKRDGFQRRTVKQYEWYYA